TPATYAQTQFTQPEDVRAEFEPFWQVFELIQKEYVDPENDPIDTSLLVNGAIKGMVEALEDQNSGYMNPELFPVLFDDLSGAIEGIGVVIQNNEKLGGIEVMNILEGTPAAAAGIKIGDVFAAVNGEEVLGLTQIELAAKVRGPAGTSVNITMLRDGERVEFTLVRARIEIENVESWVIEDTHIGYIKLNEFTSTARNEIDSAIDALDPSTLDGLIIDFRG